MLQDAVSSFVLAMRWICVEAGIASHWDSFNESNCAAALRGPLQAHVSRSVPSAATSNTNAAELLWSDCAFLYCEEIAVVLPQLTHPDTDYRVSHRGVDTLSLFLEGVSFRSSNKSRQLDYVKAIDQVHRINDELWRRRYDAPHQAITSQAPVGQRGLLYPDPRMPVALNHERVAESAGLGPRGFAAGGNNTTSSSWPMSPAGQPSQHLHGGASPPLVDHQSTTPVMRGGTPVRRHLSSSRAAEVVHTQTPPPVTSTISSTPTSPPVISYRPPTPTAIHQLRNQSPTRRPPSTSAATPNTNNGFTSSASASAYAAGAQVMHHTNTNGTNGVYPGYTPGLAPSPSPKMANGSPVSHYGSTSNGGGGALARDFNEQAILAGSPVRLASPGREGGGFHITPGYDNYVNGTAAVNHYTTLGVQKAVPRPAPHPVFHSAMNYAHDSVGANTAAARKTPVADRPPPIQLDSSINGLKKRSTIR